MFIKTSHSGLNRLIIGAAAMAITCGVAFAEDGPAQKNTLPGVTGDYRIAKPAPEPEPDDALPGSGNGQFKIGNTDVRISGSITVDVGTGGVKPSNR